MSHFTEESVLKHAKNLKGQILVWDISANINNYKQKYICKVRQKTRTELGVWNNVYLCVCVSVRMYVYR